MKMKLSRIEFIISNTLNTTICFLLIGEVQITNAFDASLVLINPDLPEVVTFKSM